VSGNIHEIPRRESDGWAKWRLALLWPQSSALFS